MRGPLTRMLHLPACWGNARPMPASGHQEKNPQQHRSPGAPASSQPPFWTDSVSLLPRSRGLLWSLEAEMHKPLNPLHEKAIFVTPAGRLGAWCPPILAHAAAGTPPGLSVQPWPFNPLSSCPRWASGETDVPRCAELLGPGVGDPPLH